MTFKAFVLFMTAVSGVSFASGASDSRSSYEQEGSYDMALHRSNLRYFSCKAFAPVDTADGIFVHEIFVDGTLDLQRGTLAGRSVHVSIGNHFFAQYKLPQFSFWVQNGELLSLNLRGQTVNGKVLKFSYAGEGNYHQNRVEVSKNRNALYTNDVTCRLSRGPW